MILGKLKPQKTVWRRKIIHVDMDAFFAAVEQRDHAEYQGKPVVVGGDPFGRGVVSTASYEARRFGIHSAMPSAQARKLCPHAIFLRPHFQKYSEASEQVMSILRQHTDLVEPVSMDEAYLDVTNHRFGIENPVMIAELIKQSIRAVTRLTASAGVAPNLFLAKIASDFQKPDGLTVIPPDKVSEFLEPLPVRKIPGVGPVTEAQLHRHKLFVCGDLLKAGAHFLYDHFGKFGLTLFDRACGEDDSEVEPDLPTKQLSVEETFPYDVLDASWLQDKLGEYADDILRQLEAEGRRGRTIVLKVKYHDFESITRSKTLEHFPAHAKAVWGIACDLLMNKTLVGKKPIRLIGLGISGLEPVLQESLCQQKELF